MTAQRDSGKIHVLQEDTDVWSILNILTKREELDEPFYLYDLNDIIRKYYEMKTAMPRITPHYAVKCNNNEMLVKTLAALGINFDCASMNEIEQVLNLGVPPTKIIFANTNKSITHLRYAAKVGVDLMTFDNESELHKIKEFYPQSRLVIRIKCDDPSLHIKFGRKFGCHHEYEAPKLLQVAKNLELNVVGVSFHIGSGGYNPPIFGVAIKYAREVFDCAKKIDYNFSILDIGGGFQGNQGYTLDEVSKVIDEALNEHFPDPAITVISEPGRWFMASAGTIATKIIGTHPLQVKDESTQKMKEHIMYYINDSVFGSFLGVIYNEKNSKVPSLKLYDKTKKLIWSSVWGCTCSGVDQVTSDVNLPELKSNQWLFYEDMGAYSRARATNFNGFPFTKEIIIINKTNWNLLKNKTPFVEEDFVTTNSLKTLLN